MTIARCLALAAAAALFAAAPAHAHQRQLLRVGDTDYLVVIGSLNEPVYTGDRSGVDLTVLAADPTAPFDSRAAGAKPVTGLDQTLEVEVKAQGASKVYALRPVYRNPGKYEAIFYPTVAATYAYRLFGTLGGTPIDVTFTCTPRGQDPVEDLSVVPLGGGVIRKGIVGAFGCPVDRAEAEFPPRR
ncbi:MAG TPA: hypothetical protein VIM86_17460 [Thermodesulfobacteriota bacterium]